jgi:transglutaminase-like putative cysteine protease
MDISMRIGRRILFLGATIALTGLAGMRARAQAPHITAHGDPSIADDTIYKLAVDSAAYPEQATVLLLDDGVIRMDADGHGTETFRQVTQVLQERAVRGFEEREFGYDPDHQQLTINWIRVLSRTGQVISAKPSQTQLSDVPAAMANPVYVHRKVLHVSLSGVAAGTLVDISYTLEERAPYRPGDFFESWSVNANTTVRRSRLLIDVPKDLALRIDERNLNFKRQETIAGNRKVYEWATKDVAWNKPEMFEPQADSNNVNMWLSVSAPGSWSDIGKWYAGLSHSQLASGSQIQDSVRRITAHATTLEDSILAIHRWVAQDVRYVSVSLGIGGYQPRSPATVLATGFGDCKDKATLFIAALSDIGVQAYPVLLNAGGRPDRTVPTIGAFDHEIAAIKRPNGYQFVDLTSELSRFGTLPYGDEDEFALVVHPDGTTEEVTTPRDKLSENKTSSLLTGTLSTEGKFNGRVEIAGTGISELGLRAMMRTPMDSAQRADLQRRLAAAIFPNARGDSLTTFDGKDFHATPRIAFLVRDGDATQQSGETDILTLRSAASHWGQIADQLEAHGPRKMPIDAAQVVGPTTVVDEMRITLPVGWHAHLPAGVTAASAFGHYESEYRQDGRDLVIVHRLSGAEGVLPKERIGDLITWLRALAKDRVSFIVIDHPAAAEASGTAKT